MNATATKETEAVEPVEPVEPDEATEPETEQDDGNEEADAEPEPEPEPESSGRKVKSPQEQFQAAFAAFVKKAAACFEILPADVAVAPHPGVVGIMLPGFAEPRTHPDFTTCTTCNGRGTILTGAVTGDPSKDYHTCPDTRCKGNGYWTKQSAAAPLPTTGPLAATPPAGEPGEWQEAPAWMGDPSLTPGQ